MAKPEYACVLHEIVRDCAVITRLEYHAALGRPEPLPGHLRVTLTSRIVHHDEEAGRIETQNSVYVYRRQ